MAAPRESDVRRVCRQPVQQRELLMHVQASNKGLVRAFFGTPRLDLVGLECVRIVLVIGHCS